MLKKSVIALGLLIGSLLTAWAASSTLSGLSSGGPIAGTDLFYDVQTVGVGGVKVTGTQLLNFVFGNISGNCTSSPSGNLTCSGLATNTMTSIAAGTNITTSGTVTNTTVNVVATPSFTTVIATGNLTANIAQFPGFLTASGANLNTATIVSLGASTQCVQSVAGVLSGTGSSCGSGQFSIAAGSNITTSGTANNITVNVVATPTFTNLTSTITAAPGFLTASGANFQTTTIASINGSVQCVQASTGGVLSGTGSTCGSGGTTVKGGPILPSSLYLGGANGNLSSQFYTPNTNTSGAGFFEGVGVVASLSSVATASLQFNMPENIPSGNARLRILQMGNATTGSVSYNVADAVTTASSSLGTITLNFEPNFLIFNSTADVLIERKLLLTVTPTSNQIMSVLIGVTSTVGQTVVFQPSIVWE